MNTTVCEGDSATFTCVVFIPSGLPTSPNWGRDGAVVDMMRHVVTSNLTGGTTTPVSISSTLTVSNVTVVDDDVVSYQCGIGSESSTAAILKVVGKCHTFIISIFSDVHMHM